MGGDEFSPEVETADGNVLTESRITRVAVLPTAAADRGPDDAAANGVQHFQRLGVDAEAVMIVSRIDAELRDHSSIGKFGLFFFTGGSPEQLVSIVKNSRALHWIHSAWLDGSVIGGSSAGAMALGRKFRCPRHGWFEGLGLANVISVPHAEAVDKGVRREVLDRAGSLPVVFLPSQGACLVDTSQIRCIGMRRIEVCFNGDSAVVEPGESVQSEAPLIR